MPARHDMIDGLVADMHFRPARLMARSGFRLDEATALMEMFGSIHGDTFLLLSFTSNALGGWDSPRFQALG